jgi:hypothetical protein
MECLLISGSESVGKSEAIYRLANRFLSAGFDIEKGNIPEIFQDFRVVIKGNNNRNKKIRIIINSATDTELIIRDFKKFFDDNGDYNILISSIRDDNFWPRAQFFTIMEMSTPKDFILEIPLAKITRKEDNRLLALNWYQTQIDILLNHILNNNPFDILIQ